MLRVVFMGTPEFAVPALEVVAKAFDVVAVYTQPDRPVGRGLEVKASSVKLQAARLGIPVHQPERLSMPGEFEKLAVFAPDVIVVVAFGQILKRNVLDLPRLGCVNIHSSLLPRWRGAAPIQHAILAGDNESGVTTMKLVEKLDAGAILLQEKTPITPSDTGSTLHDRLAEIGARLILPTLRGLADGTIAAHEQNEAHVTYASKLTKEMEVLDFARTSVELDRQIRALNPWPGTTLLLESGDRLKIKEAKLWKDISGPVGSIYEKAGMLLLGTAQGSLELVRLQFQGKKEVNAAAFLNGLRGRGQVLPIRLKSM